MNPRRPALTLCCLLVLAGVLAAVALRTEDPAPPPAATAPGPAARAVREQPELRALRVLRAWDARRAAAWATGDPGTLPALYVPGSRAGRVDRAMLRAYADRGLRVTGLRMQLLEVDLLAAGRDELRLLVTDRLAYAVARGRGRAVVLPRDQPSTRVLRLRRWSGSWRVVAVRAQRSAEASTPATSGSANR